MECGNVHIALWQSHLWSNLMTLTMQRNPKRLPSSEHHYMTYMAFCTSPPTSIEVKIQLSYKFEIIFIASRNENLITCKDVDQI